MTISDDGRGIDYHYLQQKAKTLGGPADSGDVANIVFNEGLSSRDHQGEYSGIGIGMMALKRAVDAQSGKIDIQSSQGVGTTVTIKVPLKI